MLFPKAKWGNKPEKKPRFSRTTNKEEAIQRECEAILNDSGLTFIRIPDSVYKACFGINSPLTEAEQQEARRYLKDLPDLTVLQENGKYFCVELKTETGKQKQGQKKFEKKIGSGNYQIIRSIEAFKKFLKKKRLLK